MLGVIDLDKPVGPTSHDMVGLVRRLTGTRRVGHAGTLDPLASGVLPILVGGATRLSAELSGGTKRYRATIRLGARSATDDAQGPIVPGDAPLPPRTAIEEALRTFTGTFVQRPPVFSARKAGGRSAHRAARSGSPLDLPPREVTVHSLEVCAVSTGARWTDVEIDLRCEAGTYVRSIARDLGELLGCGGYLGALRRTEAAGLSVSDALPPDRLADLAEAGRIHDALLPVGPLLRLPPLELASTAARRFANGGAVPTPGEQPGRRAVFAAGELLGIGEVKAGALHPATVLTSTGEA